MQSNFLLLVNQFDYVTKGQKIGEVGSSGNSTVPHLHFEVLLNGVAIDPLELVQHP